ncbi:hypothetical protein [Adhaeribacter soli]|uniref:STAS/SEC14 domain-containing protein n=1 Tax=Adhaeribacter soli TaxID=2607655 RepID=A0A5N1IMF5_9BACT|nr:hypothetical protein [Adhaeribacter soli]KAA9331252.1 hypothetical protein F0P94_15320 [Adhaeribacter soli]
MLFFQKPFVTIHFEEQFNLARVKWSRFENSYEYREGLSQALALGKLKAPQNWILDLRELSAIRLNDQNWTVTHFLPQFHAMVMGGKLAIILSEDFYSNASIGNIARGMQPLENVSARYFNDEESAMAWFASMAELQ